MLRHLARAVEAHGGPVGIMADKPTALAVRLEIDRVKRGEAVETKPSREKVVR